MTDVPQKQSRRLVVAFAVLTLAIPVTGFLIFGDAFEQRIGEAVRNFESPQQLFVAIVAVLAIDLFLPVPSSVVLTYGGMSIGIMPATAAGCLGLLISSEIGYWLGRLGGRPIAKRFISKSEFEQSGQPSRKTSLWWLVLSRPLPLIAEAATIGAGMARVPHGSYLLVIVIANLWVTLTFTMLGAVGGADYQWHALFASAAVPLAATWIIRSRIRTTAPTRRKSADR